MNTDDIIHDLVFDTILSSEESELIMAKKTRDERVEISLDILLLKPDDKYVGFLRVLLKHDMPHIAAVLESIQKLSELGM